MQQSDKDDACVRSKSYYRRLKSDPKKWADYIQRKVEKQRERRARVRNQREESSVSPEKTAPLREESAEMREESVREESPPPVGSEESSCEESLTQREESPVVTGDLRHLGGKHSPPTISGDVGLSPENIIAAWHETWAKPEVEEFNPFDDLSEAQDD